MKIDTSVEPMKVEYRHVRPLGFWMVRAGKTVKKGDLYPAGKYWIPTARAGHKVLPGEIYIRRRK